MLTWTIALKKHASTALVITLTILFVASRMTASAFENLCVLVLLVVAPVAVVSAWMAAAILALCVYVAVSLDDVPDLANAALHASAPAMWLPAAFALLSVATLETTIIALLVIANSVRLLVSRAAPQVYVQMHARNRSRRRIGYFCYMTGAEFARETLPTVVGAFAIHAAVIAVWAGYPLAAAALVALGAGMWTSTAVERRSVRAAGNANLRRTAAGAVIAFVLAASLSLGQLRSNGGNAIETVLAQSRLAWTRLGHTSQPEVQTGGATVTKLEQPKRQVAVPAKDLVPGVILRPDRAPRPQTPARRTVPRGVRSMLEPVVMPFTGEYHLFPTSSGSVQSDSVVYRGTPLDAVYRNVGGGPIETEAYQPFAPAIDFTNCGKIRLSLRHEETAPALASLQLIAVAGVENLGSEVFALEGAPQETLEFAVPKSPRLARVTGMRIGFRCDPSRRSESTKVAVLHFEFVCGTPK